MIAGKITAAANKKSVRRRNQVNTDAIGDECLGLFYDTKLGCFETELSEKRDITRLRYDGEPKRQWSIL